MRLVEVGRVCFVHCKACRWLVEVRFYHLKACRRLVEVGRVPFEHLKRYRRLEVRRVRFECQKRVVNL